MRTLTTLIILIVAAATTADNEEMSSTSTTPPPPLPQPIYTPPQQSPAYVAHQTYPYSDNYGFFYPQMLQPQGYAEKKSQPNYAPTEVQQTQGALQFTLHVLAKFGLFVLGGAALLLIGGVFTGILCYFTPICVISFPGVSSLNQESVRALMTPDKISAAAALVQDAIGKYQRLQRATRT